MRHFCGKFRNLPLRELHILCDQVLTWLVDMKRRDRATASWYYESITPTQLYESYTVSWSLLTSAERWRWSCSKSLSLALFHLPSLPSFTTHTRTTEQVTHSLTVGKEREESSLSLWLSLAHNTWTYLTHSQALLICSHWSRITDLKLTDNFLSFIQLLIVNIYFSTRFFL